MNKRIKVFVFGLGTVLVLMIAGLFLFMSSLNPEELLIYAVPAAGAPVSYHSRLAYLYTTKFHRIPASYHTSNGLPIFQFLINGCQGQFQEKTPCREMATFMLNEGSDRNAASQDEVGLTPMHLAVLYGDSPLATFLLEKGADVNRMAEGKKYRGMTPVRFARELKTSPNPAGVAAVSTLLKSHGGHE